MAYDLLVVGEQVKSGKASQALWIARATLRRPKPPIVGMSHGEKQ